MGLWWSEVQILSPRLTVRQEASLQNRFLPYFFVTVRAKHEEPFLSDEHSARFREDCSFLCCVLLVSTRSFHTYSDRVGCHKRHYAEQRKLGKFSYVAGVRRCRQGLRCCPRTMGLRGCSPVPAPTLDKVHHSGHKGTQQRPHKMLPNGGYAHCLVLVLPGVHLLRRHGCPLHSHTMRS